MKCNKVGEIRTMNCGMKATIIQYRKSIDIDAQFEDGYIAEHKTYDNFKNGRITTRNIKQVRKNKINNRLGETRMMNCGMKATIIQYRKSIDIDVQFEDGYIAEYKTYDNFKNGRITTRNTKQIRKNKINNRLGETRMMNCGMKATIIQYRKNNDIDVQFEDGYIAENKTYRSFKNGKIANKNIKQIRKNKINNRLGETRMMNCGMKAIIIQYRKNIDIDVQFEDGYIAEHKTYDSFKNGNIANKNIKRIRKNKRNTRIGEMRMMNCGMEATIIQYRKNDDVDIQFEDGYIAEHKTYQNFKNGNIANGTLQNKLNTYLI